MSLAAGLARGAADTLRRGRKRGIKAVRHVTLPVGSDHDFLAAELVIVNKDATTVRVGVINLGPANVAKVLATVLPGLGGRGILVTVEAGGQLDAIEDEAAGYGWRVMSRTGPPGAASTLVLVGWKVNTRRSFVRRLLRRVFVGPGAGPQFNKPKWATGGRVECDGVIFGVSAVHFLASQHRNARMIFALQMARTLTAIVADRRAPWIVGGDWNTDFGKDRGLAKWLRGRGWTTTHDVLGVLPTHGRRAIDAIAWRRSDSL